MSYHRIFESPKYLKLGISKADQPYSFSKYPIAKYISTEVYIKKPALFAVRALKRDYILARRSKIYYLIIIYNGFVVFQGHGFHYHMLVLLHTCLLTEHWGFLFFLPWTSKPQFVHADMLLKQCFSKHEHESETLSKGACRSSPVCTVRYPLLNASSKRPKRRLPSTELKEPTRLETKPNMLKPQAPVTINKTHLSWMSRCQTPTSERERGVK